MLIHLLLQEEEIQQELDQKNIVCELTKLGLKRRRPRRWWIHPIFRGRVERGSFSTLMPELQIHGECFREYFRMSREQFDIVLSYVKSDIEKKETWYRSPVSANEPLAICLR